MNTIFRDLSLIWTMIHCCIMFMLLFQSRYTAKKTNILTATVILPLTVVNMLNVFYLGIERAGQLMVITSVLPSLILFFIMAKNRDTRFLFTFCVVDTIVLEVLIATNLLDTFLGFGNYIVMFVCRLLILPLLEFLIVKYIRKPYHILQQKLEKGWGVFSVLAVLFYAALMLITFYPNIIIKRPEYFPYIILMLILVPVMYMTVAKVLWTQIKLFDAAAENRALDMQIKMANERLCRGSENENRLQTLRHDMKHQMLLLNDYIINNKTDEAKEYIRGLIENIDKSKPQTYCNNNSVNVVLSYYNSIADEKGIKFETNIRLAAKLSVNETDLAVVLSNGLENAINALETCDYKKIIVNSFTDADKIYLEIKNPFNTNVVFDGNAPKSKQKNHGFGTKSMAAIVEKYEGAYSFALENGCFVFRCSM